MPGLLQARLRADAVLALAKASKEGWPAAQIEKLHHDGGRLANMAEGLLKVDQDVDALFRQG